jgi:hypothetical protein
MIPKIKKSIKKFMLGESGAVSKQSLLKMGTMAAIASIAASDEVLAGGCSCGGATCDKDYDEHPSPTDDMLVVFEDEIANLFNDQPDFHMNETQTHANSDVWACDDRCSNVWAYSSSHNSGIYNWGCVDYWDNKNSEHWNAGHHRNAITLSSIEENTDIQADHSNEVFLVDKEMYPRDFCGTQHCNRG